VTPVVILTFYYFKSIVKIVINYQRDAMISIMFLITLICLVLVPLSFAETNYSLCLDDCNPNSSKYKYCKSQCSFNYILDASGNSASSYSKSQGKADYECVKNCTAKRYSLIYCKKMCRY